VGIEDAITLFTRACLTGLKDLDMWASEKSSGFQLVLSQKNAERRGEMFYRHGPYRFRSPESWQSYYPHSDRPGVYFFLDVNDRVIHVGKGETSLGYRLSAHLGKRGPEGQFAESALSSAESIIAVGLKSEATAFLAPALESWLLANFHFEANARLTGR